MKNRKFSHERSGGLKQFREDLFRFLIIRPIFYWDNTVVMADKFRICLRFYGDETAACYVAHDKKDMDGIMADGILEVLTEMTGFCGRKGLWGDVYRKSQQKMTNLL